jgi:hypothetical protein
MNRTHPKAAQGCSADFQSAVSRISNPQAWGENKGLPTGSRRYSRLETCATGNAGSSGGPRACSADFQSAVSRISNPPASWTERRRIACIPGRGVSCRLEAGDTADWKSALRNWAGHRAVTIATPSAAPTPVFGLAAKPCGHRIVPDILRNAGALLVIPHPVVERLWLPESSLGQTQHSFRAQRSELLPTLHDLSQQVIRHRPKQYMEVVRHYHPFAQKITLFVEVNQGLRDQPCDLGAPQMAGPRALIKVTLHGPMEVPIDNLLRVNGGPASPLGIVERPQPRCAVGLETHQDFVGQRISQPEGDEIFPPLPFDVWEVPARMDAASKRGEGSRFHTSGPQLVLHSVQPRILRIRRHAPSLSAALFECNVGDNVDSRDGQGRCSADFQSAVSRISNPLAWRRKGNLPTGSRRYSRLETCATSDAASKNGQRGCSADFQFAVSRISNPQAFQTKPKPSTCCRSIRPRCRLEAGDTADWKSALRNFARLRAFTLARRAGARSVCRRSTSEPISLRRFRPPFS